MKNNDWKKINKPPSCTLPPWYNFIPKNNRDSILRQINQECIDIYGYEFSECPKRKICFKMVCIGRPLPWLSPTAKPYLEMLRGTHRIENNELYITGCEGCPLLKTCDKPCMEVTDFINREKSREVPVYYKENIDTYSLEDIDFNESNSLDNVIYINFNKNKVPWDVLTKNRRKIVELYIFKNNDFKYISDKLQLHNQAYIKYEFYSALTKLSEYGIMREFYNKNNFKLTTKQKEILYTVYFKNKSLTKTAKMFNISKQTVQQTIKRILYKYSIKWNIFVRKENNKLIYNVPEIFK